MESVPLRLCDKNCRFKCPISINDIARNRILEKFQEIEGSKFRHEFLAKYIKRCYSKSETAKREQWEMEREQQQQQYQDFFYYEKDQIHHAEENRHRRHNNGFFIHNGYYLKRVCRTFFKKTFDINETVIRNVLRLKNAQSRLVQKKENAKYNLFCNKKCHRKCERNVGPFFREAHFKKYLALSNKDARKKFLATHIEKFDPRNRCPVRDSKRRLNYAFYFIVGSKKFRVCKDFFKNFYNITDTTIKNIVRKRNKI